MMVFGDLPRLQLKPFFEKGGFYVYCHRNDGSQKPSGKMKNRFTNFDTFQILEKFILLLISAFALSIVFVPLLDTIGVIDVISPLEEPLSWSEAAQIAGAMGSVLFTIGLVILYREQTLIQNRQESWMEADHTPDLSIDEWRIDSNTFEFDIANLGDGTAKDLTLILELEIIGTNNSFNSINVDEVREPLIREEVVSQAIQSENIEPVIFSAFPEITISWRANHGKRPSYKYRWKEYRENPSDILSALKFGGVTDIEYTISVEYAYGKSSTDELSIFAGKAEVTPDLDLEGLITFETYEELETDLDRSPKSL